jgi:hypothetical protein
MLTAIKLFLRWLLQPLLYFGGMVTIILTIFKRADLGLFLLVILIPQPNLWYKLHEYPMGKDFLDLLWAGVFLGMIVQRKGFVRTGNAILICLTIVVSYFALLNSSFRFSLPFPVSTAIYLLVINVFKDEDQGKKLVIIMAIVILVLGIRSYRNYTAGATFRDLSRIGGPFETVGLGSNHFGAFIAEYCAVLLGLAITERGKYTRYLFLAAVLFGLHPLFFSYSRGAYFGAAGALLFFGVVKKRSLLILVIVLAIAWKTVLPTSVVDRISMTKDESGELESSASSRLSLWEQAIGIFKENPMFGVGYGGFGLTVQNEQALTDTHNYYLKLLSEQGVIGLSLLLVLFLMALKSGWVLFRKGETDFARGLGLGFAGCVIACMITNMFGDRFSYFALGSYFFVFWALVDRGILNLKNHKGEREVYI